MEDSRENDVLKDTPDLPEAENTAGAEAPTPEEAPGPAEAFKAQLEALNAQLAALDDKYMRLAAEYDNFRKRTAKEREALTGFVVRDTAAKFLPVLDSLNIAISGGGNEAVTAGLTLVSRAICDVLTSVGIEEIETAGTFDPNLHNAVVHIDDPALPENSVVEVLQKGYKYKDIVIRHAMVKVAN
ncbi:MAG TPA: nucleotide exchange factor GrpE [Candidatus Acidoferrum sp.]|nr:nucleotide exchange factor GrpE [Candidatus Acidoferrum sp.]